MRVRAILTGLLATVIPIAAFVIVSPDHPSRTERPKGGREAERVSVTVNPGTMPDPLAAMEASREAFFVQVQTEVDTYLDALHQADLERERAEAAARARAAMARPVIRTGSCCGPHSDAWWWGVAICEQGGRNDPYFGYFSWMDGSAAGMTWEQQVAKSNALLATVSSESPAWAPSCVAAGYAASPNG